MYARPSFGLPAPLLPVPPPFCPSRPPVDSHFKCNTSWINISAGVAAIGRIQRETDCRISKNVLIQQHFEMVSLRYSHMVVVWLKRVTPKRFKAYNLPIF